MNIQDAKNFRGLNGAHLLEALPLQGPALVMAAGPVDPAVSLLLMGALEGLRPDCMALASRAKRPQLRSALRHLRAGGVLLYFPWPGGAKMQAQWPAGDGGGRVAAWLASATKAPVLPLNVSASASLPGRLQLSAGRLLGAARLAGYTDRGSLADYLRLRAWLLREKDGGAAPRLSRKLSAPLASAIPPELLEGELARMHPMQKLATLGTMQAWTAQAFEIPMILREIGRLREASFRAAGEGTGKPVDLDRFDQHYRQLFIWDSEARKVVGGYRMGCTDSILKSYGPEGLYTHSLLQMKKALLEDFQPALELGRSFVRPEYQRSYAPLMLLWKGIGAFVARYPRYHRLFGVVSISDDYHPLSKELMVSFVKQRLYRGDMARLARPRKPYAPAYMDRPVDDLTWRMGASMDEISDWVQDLEKDGKGVPVLLRQYAQLGASFFGFNVDPEFGHVVDGILMVDLLETGTKILKRYLGEEGLKNFQAWHDPQAGEGAPI